MSVRAVTTAWRNDAAFVAFWVASMSRVRPSAYFWEMPPVSLVDWEFPFQCVAINAPALEGRQEDSRAFSAYFGKGNEGAAKAVTFLNLSGDALLVAPAPTSAQERVQCGHLATFLRSCSAAQGVAFWEQVAAAMMQCLGNAPIWTSTSGLGVNWLHARVCKAPKYYQWRAYRDAEFWNSVR